MVKEAVGEGAVVESLSGVSATRRGVVEGTAVHDIILDTGCLRTMIHQDSVPAEKRVSGEAVTLWCAHGDVVLYPLANVNKICQLLRQGMEGSSTDEGRKKEDHRILLFQSP